MSENEPPPPLYADLPESVWSVIGRAKNPLRGMVDSGRDNPLELTREQMARTARDYLGGDGYTPEVTASLLRQQFAGVLGLRPHRTGRNNP